MKIAGTFLTPASDTQAGRKNFMVESTHVGKQNLSLPARFVTLMAILWMTLCVLDFFWVIINWPAGAQYVEYKVRIIPLLGFLAGVGLIKRKEWGRIFALCLCGIVIVFELMRVLAPGIFSNIYVALVFLVFYLLPQVRGEFR